MTETALTLQTRWVSLKLSRRLSTVRIFSSFVWTLLLASHKMCEALLRKTLLPPKRDFARGFFHGHFFICAF